MELRAPAEGAHALAELRLDEGVDDDCRAPFHPLSTASCRSATVSTRGCLISTKS